MPIRTYINANLINRVNLLIRSTNTFSEPIVHEIARTIIAPVKIAPLTIIIKISAIETHLLIRVVILALLAQIHTLRSVYLNIPLIAGLTSERIHIEIGEIIALIFNAIVNLRVLRLKHVIHVARNGVGVIAAGREPIRTHLSVVLALNKLLLPQ